MQAIRWFLGKIILALDALFAPKEKQLSEAERARANYALAGHSLYQYEACPFCVKVRRALREEGVSLPLRDAKSDLYRRELLEGGGKLQVPCLRIDRPEGVQWLYESNDIIAYLRERLQGAAA